MTPQIARIVRTEYRTSQDLLEAIADALAVARVAAPEAPVQLHALTENGQAWELSVLRHPIPTEAA